MRRCARAAFALAIVGTSASAFAQSFLVTETFNTNTDGYWSHQDNRTAPQNYGWSNTDNTGSVVNPPSGTATGAGEMGGTFARTGGMPNFYGFNLGSIDPFSESFQASGILRTSGGGGAGLNLGFFAGADSWGQGGDAASFIGLGFDDLTKAQAFIYSASTGRDRSGVETALPTNTAVPFSMQWSPAPAGGSEKGILNVTINGATQSVSYGGDLGNMLPLTHFGVLGISADGGNGQMFFDDLTFSSYNNLGGAPGWALDNSGDWLVPGNWIGGVPNGSGATATFGGTITAPRLVYANQNVTVGTVDFNNANTYLLAGLGTMTLQVPSGNALVNVQQGSHKINLPVVVASNTTVNVAGGATLRVSDPVTINSGVAVTQTGSGTVLYESTVNVLGGGSIQFGNSSHMAGLSLASAASAQVTPGTNKTLKIDNLNVAGGKLDLKDNKLITAKSVGTASGGVYNGLQRDVQTAYAGGAWTGNGLTTSMPQASDGLTTVAVATGAQLGVSTFGGQAVAPTDSVAFYTYGGDTNFDGMVSGDDYGTIDFSILVPGSDGYYNGDFNYDGVINGDDYGIIDFTIIAQGAPFPTSGASAGLSGVTAVPEPAACGLALLAATGIVGARRRRSR